MSSISASEGSIFEIGGSEDRSTLYVLEGVGQTRFLKSGISVL